jgi:hypothetical protein
VVLDGQFGAACAVNTRHPRIIFCYDYTSYFVVEYAYCLADCSS